MVQKTLVIVESPAKAKTIAKFLGKGYKVCASNGHVRDLPRSQMGVDVEKDFEPRYITIRGRGSILEAIRREAKGAKRVLLATDPDREGEAISWHLAHILNLDSKQKCRIEFHEITQTAVKNAISGARAIDSDLVDAQQARRVLDRLVGYMLSPILWAKVKKGLSAGRVQSVATAMICQREQEIAAFIPEEYWSITAQLYDGKKKFEAEFYGFDGEKKELKSQAQVQQVLGRIHGTQFPVTSVKTAERRRTAPPPFTTSSLQQEAVKKLSFTTKRTMMVAQQLYEGVDIAGMGTQGLVTYIRTDSVRIAKEAQLAAAQWIEAEYGKEYLPQTPNEYKGRKQAQDAHEAIRPTMVECTPESVKGSLTAEQFKLYRLIYTRFIASQMSPAVLDVTTAVIDLDGCAYHASGSVMRFAGFTRVYDQDKDSTKGQILPALAQGQLVTLLDNVPEQHFTQPPTRYTEASLVRALEENGIGRPSTYAPVITTILERGYVRKENKALCPTELGIIVTNLLEEHFNPIIDIDFTAGMEEQLDQVEAGQLQWKRIVEAFFGPFEEAVKKAEQTIEKIEVADEESDVPCEKCGRMMVYKMGRFGRFLACPGFPDCRNTKSIQVALEGVTCPQCSAAVLQKRSRNGRLFYGCENYPACDYVSWDQPVNEKCEKCGGPMVKKRNPKGEFFYLCKNGECAAQYPAPSAQ